MAIQEHALSVPTMLLFSSRNFQAEIEAKELLLQQAVSHQAKLEADTRLLQGKEANLQGRLNHVMKVSETALDETSPLLQRRQSRGGDKNRDGSWCSCWEGQEFYAEESSATSIQFY